MCHTNLEIWKGKTDHPNHPTGKPNVLHPPILINSGSSGKVVEGRWLPRWANGDVLTLANSSLSLRFGDGIARPSLGKCVCHVTISPGHANKTDEITIRALSDVAMAEIPLLISKKTLVATQCQLGFITSILSVEGNVTIHLKNPPSGHLSLSGTFIPRRLMALRKMRQIHLKIPVYRQP